MAGHDQHQRLLAVRPAADAVEEAHRPGGVDQGGDAGGVQRGQQDAGGDADAFGDVIVARHGFLIGQAPGEDRDQPGRRLEKGLVGPGAERAHRVEPGSRRAIAIELALLLLGGDADRRLGLRPLDRAEMPGLAVGAARCRAGGPQRRLDHFAGNGPLVKGTAAAAEGDFRKERPGPRDPYIVAKFRIGLPRQRFVLGHGRSP